MLKMPEKLPLVGIVLVHYGDPSPTRRCLESLAACETAPYRIFISDHGPTSLADSLGVENPNITILERPNDGFASGCNHATEAAFEAGCEWIWLLNNDATLPAPTLKPLLEMALNLDGPALWGTFQIDRGRRIGVDHLPNRFPSVSCATNPLKGLASGCVQLKSRETLSGASILFSRETWNKLGPMPEWCFLYWEDTAWCLRAHELGIPMILSPLEIIHPRGTTTQRHSPLTTYYGVRNMLLLHRKYLPKGRFDRIKEAIHMLQKRFFQGRFKMIGPTLAGIRDAHRGIRGKKP